MAKQIPLTCSGHTRPVVDLAFSRLTDDGYFMISACKGRWYVIHINAVKYVWFKFVYFDILLIQHIFVTGSLARIYFV